MADYRLSATIISRACGQSSTASAAYRAACQLRDERTGQPHDYTRKRGVVHSEILTPDHAPEWMHDRAQLWNAVEAAEKRKDAQLSREIQLSLPHELNHKQRVELTRRFVQTQFVDQGMIADVNVHTPSRHGDDRNHHAHIMLTLRELTGAGFSKKKNREWNDPEQLKGWRQAWARLQNQALEKAGSAERVDHRSYNDRGIDREPSQHLGSTAHAMERNGKRSDRGEQNRAIQKANTDRATRYQDMIHVQLAIQQDRQKIKQWHRQEMDALRDAQKLSDLDLNQKHDRQHSRLEQRLQELYGDHKKTLQAELNATERRLQRTGVVKVLRNVFGHTRSDSEAKQSYLKTLLNIAQREREQREALNQQQAAEQQREKDRQEARRDWKQDELNKAHPVAPVQEQCSRPPANSNDPAAPAPQRQAGLTEAWKKAPTVSNDNAPIEQRQDGLTGAWTKAADASTDKPPTERSKDLTRSWTQATAESNDSAATESPADRANAPTRERNP